MIDLKRLSWLALPVVLLFATAVQAAEWGRDYVELSPPQPVESRGKIEVLEFFWYRCPHCAQIEGELAEWVKKLPRDVVFKRQPAVLSDGWMPLTRAYYALEAVGALDRLHAEALRAIHEQHIDLNDPNTFFDWAAGKGVDRKKIADAYNSFSVNAKAGRAKQMTSRYKITGVPAFVVNGKYQTSAYLTGGNKRLFETLDALIAQERKAGK
ncbi:MAG: thiol:disulfide interchange protein DsbA/DsbL [Thiobacillaceae bacterium]|jgi:thiol:disulfide interchange protein DsbA|nr:thiol:disulfide interchange protein DsbA/DsbL [Thiobacillaceae bacterium]